MIPCGLKLILLLLAITVLEITVVSGVKCYGCTWDDYNKQECHAPPPTSIQLVSDIDITSDVADNPYCILDIGYKTPGDRTSGNIQYIRRFGLEDKEDIKEIHGFVLPDCNDFTKFPDSVLKDSRHMCFCSKEMCNSAVIPKQ